jgi:signal peptidase I
MEAADPPVMSWLHPALDELAPYEPAAAHRRIRNFAFVLAIAAWLLPEFGPMGSGSTAHRAAICAAFVVVVLVAHFPGKRDGGWKFTLAAAVVAGGTVTWASGRVGWGAGFVAFTGAVLALTWARRRFSAPTMPALEYDPLPPQPGGMPAFVRTLALIGLWIVTRREFVFQAMVVPTGSMQPTIMGAHPPEPGDHLIVEGFSYLFHDPKRFDIVVFRFPLMRDRYFVKRVVGLPGEHLEIKDGDLWVDGKIAKKPPYVQATLWREIFPRTDSVGAPKDVSAGFLQARSSDGGVWTRTAPGEVKGHIKGREPTYMFFTKAVAGADARISFDAVAGADSALVARITSRGTPVQIELTTKESEQARFSVGKESRTGPFDPLRPWDGQSHHVELTVLDGDAWWSVDGHEQERVAMPPGGRGNTRVEIGVSGDATFRNLRVDRDILYDAGGGPTAYDVPKDGFFFIGDNVESSADSRRWRVEVFHPPGGAPPLRGALDVVEESGATHGGGIRIVDGSYSFVDVDGVPRSIPETGTFVEHDVPWPFATRGHLVGRAMFVFFPFATPDAGFRPRILP